MSWIARAVEERLARAAAAGELDAAPSLRGKPLPDIDRQRPAGWWADQFVAREKSYDRRQVALRDAASDRAGFWRCADVVSLRDSVAAANRRIDAANVNMVPADHVEHFDADDMIARWHRLQR
jgi:hypothetical protein